MSGWPPSPGGFSAAAPAEIIDVAFSPPQPGLAAEAQEVIWLTWVPGEQGRVAIHRGSDAEGTTLQLPPYVLASEAMIGFLPDGTPYVFDRTTSDSEDTVMLDGSVATRDVEGDDYSIDSNELRTLLPQTQYSVSDGVYSTDRAIICFVARSPSGDLAVFTVPSSGGEPTERVSSVTIPYAEDQIAGTTTVGCQP